MLQVYQYAVRNQCQFLSKIIDTVIHVCEQLAQSC